MINYNDSIKNVKPIEETFNEITCLDDLNKYIEAPCLEACKDFYQKNIITIQSNGNCKGDNPEAWITVDTSTMDNANLEICHNLAKANNGIIVVNQRNIKISHDESNNIMLISFPLNENDTIGLVSDILLNISSLFKKQDLLANRTCFESIVIEYYWSTFDDNEFTNNLKNKMDLYNIWRFESPYSEDEILCYSYADAIKYYSDLDPVNGATFVNEIIDYINTNEEAYGACDKEEGIFYMSKTDLNRHLSWLKEQKEESFSI